MRIGSFEEKPSSIRHLCTWISFRDMVHLTEVCLRQPSTGFSVVYGISNNTRNFADNSLLYGWGYQPQDNAELHLPDLLQQGGRLVELQDLPIGGIFTDREYPDKYR
ncbi:hypothetical protein [Deinococcus roseus]|uniref:Uncharacterized protein n=1 Tax=Deinococcus roseus TaxID=392414 RepID=A0ABQ2D1F9_9DEIO|nr:hypothetical protein [Deinococcus roseus]GGJ41540.1 hypothetical protein GCM10008938_29490 [Deinococcus roseus]